MKVGSSLHVLKDLSKNIFEYFLLKKQHNSKNIGSGKTFEGKPT